MTDTTQQQMRSADERKRPSALDYARRHPVLAVIGAAALGLVGGVEVAAGVLIGAAVTAVAREGDKPALETEAKQVKEHGRQLLSRVPDVKQRARAVMQAARGQLRATDQSSS